MADDNIVLRHIVAKIVFPGGSDRQESTILERNTSVSDREALEQSYWHSNCPFTVDKLSAHPDPFPKLRGGFRILCKGGPEFCARVSAPRKIRISH